MISQATTMSGNKKMDQHSLSLRLYEILEKVGASEKMRKLHRRTCTTRGIINTLHMALKSKQLIHSYICGSAYEGSVSPDLSGDVDYINCHIYRPVISDPNATPPGVALFVVRDDWTYPGYVKLQYMLDGRKLTRNDSISNEWCVFDELGRLCRRHFDGENVEGPADMAVDANGFHYADTVDAYHCNTLPVFVKNRLDMLRKQGLISNEELLTLNTMGCMFVGAGYFQSHEQGIEWRLSLSLQERYLMSKLNPTQHKVYILLKMIKTNIIEKVINCKVFTSYHCKTCLLYAAEMIQLQDWTPYNLIHCLTECIKLLILWLKNDHCPNFFNKDQNIFSKEGFSYFRQRILHTLEFLLRTNHGYLALLQTDHVGDVLMGSEWRWRNEINKKKNERILFLKNSIVKCVLGEFPVVLNMLCRGKHDLPSLLTAFNDLELTKTITTHTAAETRAALAWLQPWLHFHIAKGLVCLSYNSHCISNSKKLMGFADFHFQKAETTDHVNIRLVKASALYKYKQYEACFGLLKGIEKEFTYKVRRICPCVNIYPILFRNIQDKTESERTLSGMSIRKIVKGFFACCVIFLPSERDLVPFPLQYEMIRSKGSDLGSRNKHEDVWFDWVVVDAKVYLHLMLYLVNKKLQNEANKQAAMSTIWTLIKEDNEQIQVNYVFRQMGHRETAYNILGWILIQEQLYDAAFRCFLESWEIRPFHNAAKFYMRDLRDQCLGKARTRAYAKLNETED